MRKQKIILLVLTFLLIGLSLNARAARRTLSAGATYAHLSSAEECMDASMNGPGFYLYGLIQRKKTSPLAIFSDIVVFFPSKVKWDDSKIDRDEFDHLNCVDMIVGPAYTQAFYDQLWVNAGGGIYLLNTYMKMSSDLRADSFSVGAGLSANVQYKLTNNLFLEGGLRAGWTFWGWYDYEIDSDYDVETYTDSSWTIAGKLGLSFQY